eukprot:9025170-Ditylum_brightwellii.AAC.1
MVNGIESLDQINKKQSRLQCKECIRAPFVSASLVTWAETLDPIPWESIGELRAGDLRLWIQVPETSCQM